MIRCKSVTTNSREGKTVKRIIAMTLMMSALSFSVSAEPIPQDLLKKQNTQCRKECEVMNNELICRVLCDCAMDRFAKAFDKKGLEVYLKELDTGELSQENKVITQETGTACVAQVDIILRNLLAPDEPSK